MASFQDLTAQLLKAASKTASEEPIAKGKGAPPMPDADDDEQEAPGGDDGDMDEEYDGGDDGDDGDMDGDDDEDDAPPPAVQKSRARGGDQLGRRPAADQDFLKSLLLDKSGAPTAAAEVIEVSDVLTEMTDSMAKSLGDLQGEIGDLALTLDQVGPLIKAIGTMTLQNNKLLRQLVSEQGGQGQTVRKSTQPDPGMAFSLSRSMPGSGQGRRPNTGTPTKSAIVEGLQKSLDQGLIDTGGFSALMTALDSAGVESVLQRLPSDVRALVG